MLKIFDKGIGAMTTKNELTEQQNKISLDQLFFDWTQSNKQIRERIETREMSALEYENMKNAFIAAFELGQKSTKNPNMDKLAEYLVESIFECGDDDRGAVSRIELKIPNPDTGTEYSSVGFCRSALVNFVRRKLDELNEQTNQGGEE